MRAFKTSLALLAVSLLVAGAAGAQGWGGHGRGGGRGGGGRGGYAAPVGGPRMGGVMPGPGPGPGYARGGYPAAGGFAPPRGYARPETGGYPGYAPPAYAAPRGGWRRGEFLPQGVAGGQTLDPRRYRLRSPPPGYGWYGVGRDAYLVQRSTGLILDTVPGAW